MSNERADNVIAFRQDDLDTESKVLAAFERVRAELAAIDTIEDAFKVYNGPRKLDRGLRWKSRPC